MDADIPEKGVTFASRNTGKGNAEPSDNVVKAAFAMCEPIEKDFRNNSIATSVLAGEAMTMTEAADRYVVRMQKNATNGAIAALLEARAGS